MKKIKEYIINNKRNIILLIPAFILLILGLIFCIIGIHNTDCNILNYISKFRNEYLTTVMQTMSNLCTPVAMLTISFIVFILVKDKRIGILQFVNFGIAGVLSYALKYIFTRERPLEFMIVPESSYSFPSAHTMISMAFYGYMIYLINKSVDKKWIRITSILIISIVLFLIVISRLYLGVHYPTDIIAGLLFGYIYLFTFIKLTNKYIFNKTKIEHNK